MTVMTLLKKSNKFSLFGISMAGGVFHNVGQLIVAMVVLESLNIAYYMPVLLISGLITGFVIGIVAGEMLKRLQNLRI